MPTSSNYETLLQRYIEICGQVVEKCQDRFPYRVIFRAAADQVDSPVLLTVYDDDPKAAQAVQLEVVDADCNQHTPCACQSVSPVREAANDESDSLVDQPHVAVKLKDDGAPETCRVVRLPLSEIRSVVEDPDRVLENPGLIDWSWLKSDVAQTAR